MNKLYGRRTGGDRQPNLFCEKRDGLRQRRRDINLWIRMNFTVTLTRLKCIFVPIRVASAAEKASNQKKVNHRIVEVEHITPTRNAKCKRIWKGISVAVQRVVFFFHFLFALSPSSARRCAFDPIIWWCHLAGVRLAQSDTQSGPDQPTTDALSARQHLIWYLPLFLWNQK